MPTLTEKIDSREWTTGEYKSVTFHYILKGTSDDLTVKTLVEKPVAAYVEKVYEKGDFGQSRIGT
jgi:hypothetical protein